MRFYYASLFSSLAYTAFVVIAILLLWLVWTKLFKVRLKSPFYWVLVAVTVAGPWGEELWIAYNFGQLCRKDAGVFIYKTVKVDGFYDDTTGWGPRQLAASGFRFVESRDIIYKKLMRVERADEAARDSALAWYAKQHPGEKRPEKQYVVYPVNDKEKLVVSPNGMDAWRITKLDTPTAEYRFRSRWSGDAVRVAHKIWMEDSTVWNAQTGEVLARYVRYSRGPYWFYIGLGIPGYGCDGPDGGPDTKHSSLIYKEVLKPAR